MYTYSKLKEARRKAKALGFNVWSSQRSPYKLYAMVNGKKVHFGNRFYSDYLHHKDKKRRMNYRARHAGDYINDPTYPGFWSYRVLW